MRKIRQNNIGQTSLLFVISLVAIASAVMYYGNKKTGSFVDQVNFNLMQSRLQHDFSKLILRHLKSNDELNAFCDGDFTHSIAHEIDTICFDTDDFNGKILLVQTRFKGRRLKKAMAYFPYPAMARVMNYIGGPSKSNQMVESLEIDEDTLFFQGESLHNESEDIVKVMFNDKSTLLLAPNSTVFFEREKNGVFQLELRHGLMRVNLSSTSIFKIKLPLLSIEATNGPQLFMAVNSDTKNNIISVNGSAVINDLKGNIVATLGMNELLSREDLGGVLLSHIVNINYDDYKKFIEINDQDFEQKDSWLKTLSELNSRFKDD